jgi:hypothetical protein
VQYEKVLMSPDWQTPVGKERTNPIIVMMEQYNRELKQHNVLEEFVRMPHANQTEPNRKGLTATYVGSNRCKNCHQEAFNVWKGTKHFHGTDTLEDPKKPPVGRQYDPECMKCHTTGFEHPGGYDYPVPVLPAWVPGKRVPVAPDDLKKHNDKLRGVGCESCHGPASEHVKNPDDQRIRDLINPYRPSAQERKFENAGGPQFQKLFDVRMNALNRMCIHCHDSENDVHWLNDGVAKRWLGKGKYQAIIHRTPQAKNNNGGIAPPKEAEPPRANIGEPRPVVNGVNDKKK